MSRDPKRASTSMLQKKRKTRGAGKKGTSWSAGEGNKKEILDRATVSKKESAELGLNKEGGEAVGRKGGKKVARKLDIEDGKKQKRGRKKRRDLDLNVQKKRAISFQPIPEK